MRAIDDFTADDMITMLDLTAHPEGGYFRETFRDEAEKSGRGAVTQIYFLLKAGEPSAWHKVDATEIWHFDAGAPLTLSVSSNGEETVQHRLGRNLPTEVLHAVVPENAWQCAATQGQWTLVGCTVAPAFEFGGFTLAPQGWRPGR